MDSSSNAWRADLHLRPSRIFLFLTTLLHAAALIALMQSGLPVPWRWSLAGALAVSLFMSWRCEARKEGTVVREQREDWWLHTGMHEGGATLRRVQVWRYLAVLDFLGHDERGSWRERVVILPDAVAPDEFRRLQVRLRYGSPTGKSQSSDAA